MVKGEADKRKSQAPRFYRRETIRLLELRPCFASCNSSTVRCLEATRMLRYPSSAYRLQPTQATFSAHPPPTFCLPAIQRWPLLSLLRLSTDGHGAARSKSKAEGREGRSARRVV